MNDLIFRAKRTLNGDTVYGNVVFLSDCTLIINQFITRANMDLYSYEVLRESVQKHTGFFDMHDNPIYNGDVLTEEYEDGGVKHVGKLPVFFHKTDKIFCVDTSFEKNRSSWDEMHELDFSKLEIGGY